MSFTDQKRARANLTTICVGVVCELDGALLLIRRGQQPGLGRWSLPGGRMEPGETLVAAAAREAFEETGLALMMGSILGTTRIAHDDGAYLVYDFRAAVMNRSARPVAGTDADDAAFVPLRDVRGLTLASNLADWLVRHGILGGEG